MLVLLAGSYGLLQATAHEDREIAGRYDFVVGFLVEPAFAGERNGMSLDISTIEPAEGSDSPFFFEGAEQTLSVTVGYGDQTMPLALEPVSGEPGLYRAVFFPTLPGDYSFRLTGTLGDTTIDETFTSADGDFDAVRDPAPLRFPRTAGTPAPSTPVP
jgi:hypothetical protein